VRISSRSRSHSARPGRRRRAARAPASNPWVEAGLALLRGDPVTAAERFGAFGARPSEADAHLRAAEQLLAEGRTADAEDHAQRAHDFYCEVGARPYARRAETLVSRRSA
jgi:hypothetical protein